MPLVDIQRDLLRLAIDPDHKVEVAEVLGFENVKNLQMEVALKRIGLVAESHVYRVFAMYEKEQFFLCLSDFLKQNVMETNQWRKLLPVFLEQLQSRLSESAGDQMLRDVIQFEKWLYQLHVGEEKETELVQGYSLPHEVKITIVPFPMDVLLNEKVIHDDYLETHGIIEYLLARREGNSIDLFQLDEWAYQFISLISGQKSRNEIMTSVAQIPYEDLSAASRIQKCEEFFDELINQGIILEPKEEKVW